MGVPCAWVPAGAGIGDGGDVDGVVKMRQYLYTSDGGGEQKKYKKDMKHLVRDLKHTYWMDFDCVMHGGQLSVRSGLRVADAWTVRQVCCKRLFHYPVPILN